MLLDKRKSASERCILAIMTDGLENASRGYTKETVKVLLDRKQNEDGWLVLYQRLNALSVCRGDAVGFVSRWLT